MNLLFKKGSSDKAFQELSKKYQISQEQLNALSLVNAQGEEIVAELKRQKEMLHKEVEPLKTQLYKSEEKLSELQTTSETNIKKLQEDLHLQNIKHLNELRDQKVNHDNSIAVLTNIKELQDRSFTIPEKGSSILQSFIIRPIKKYLAILSSIG